MHVYFVVVDLKNIFSLLIVGISQIVTMLKYPQPPSVAGDTARFNSLLSLSLPLSALFFNLIH